MSSYMVKQYNPNFNKELYQEVVADKGCVYNEDVKEDMFENMMRDYL